MAKTTIQERKAKLEAELKALDAKEKEESEKRNIALGAGLEAVFKIDTQLEASIMREIDLHLKNNKYRVVLGLEKISSNKGRRKKETPPDLPPAINPLLDRNHVT